MPGRNIIGRCTQPVDSVMPWDTCTIEVTVSGEGEASGPNGLEAKCTISGSHTFTFHRVRYNGPFQVLQPDEFTVEQASCCCPCQWSLNFGLPLVGGRPVTPDIGEFTNGVRCDVHETIQDNFPHSIRNGTWDGVEYVGVFWLPSSIGSTLPCRQRADGSIYPASPGAVKVGVSMAVETNSDGNTFPAENYNYGRTDGPGSYSADVSGSGGYSGTSFSLDSFSAELPITPCEPGQTLQATLTSSSSYTDTSLSVSSSLLLATTLTLSGSNNDPPEDDNGGSMTNNGLTTGGLQTGGLQTGGLQTGGLQTGGLGDSGGLQTGGLQDSGGLQTGGLDTGSF